MPGAACPKCADSSVKKAGFIREKQRYFCPNCAYHFTVAKEGRAVDPYYVIKALQLYLEGVSYREIERILGVSHVSVMQWVRKHGIQRPHAPFYRPNYRIMNHEELANTIANRAEILGHGFMITEVGDKYLLIKWARNSG